jgi:hypothetical protein
LLEESSLETDCGSLIKIVDPAVIDRSPMSIIAGEFNRGRDNH